MTDWPAQVEYDDLAIDLTLIGITGIEDPLRDGVRAAAANCKMTGVRVTMCAGDNVLAARSIAQQCGIYTTDGIIMEGPRFRSLSQDTMKAIAPPLQVVARSSPEGKRLLVETLKERYDIVGVTGDGTNGPALKTANVGFSMGITGTEIAKEASDIILMDDNSPSIVKAIMWGRCVNDSVRKFLRFQIITNITAVVITFATALAFSGEEGVVSAVQRLWINLIMDTFAAFALATDPASPVLLNRKSDKKTKPLSVDMLKQILVQSAYQVVLIVLIVIFHFLGPRILGFHHFDDSTVKKHTGAAVFIGSKTETTLLKFARNLGWANYKDIRNSTNLIPFSSDLKAILYSNSAGEVITPRWMRDVVVFYKPSSRRGEHRGFPNRRWRPASQQASPEGDSLASLDVADQVSTRGQAASEMAAREVDHDISGRLIASPSKRARQRQLSTAKNHPRDPSNTHSQSQPCTVASSSNVFQSHDDNAIAGNSPPYCENLPNSNGNGATGLDSFGHTANRAESTAARGGGANGMAAYDRGQSSRAGGHCRRLIGFIFLILILVLSFLLLRSPFTVHYRGYRTRGVSECGCRSVTVNVIYHDT